MTEPDRLGAVKAEYAELCGRVSDATWNEYFPDRMMTLFEDNVSPHVPEEYPTMRDGQRCIPGNGVVRSCLDRRGKVHMLLVLYQPGSSELEQAPMPLGEGHLEDYEAGLEKASFFLSSLIEKQP